MTVIVANPSPLRPNDPGQVTYGFYVVKDGLLTMTDGEGAPVRPGLSGELLTHRLQPSEAPDDVARRLTRKIRLMVRGDDRGGFNRRLEYSKMGVA